MTKKMLRRFRIFLAICLFIFIVLGARLAQLQILGHEYYYNRAEVNKTRILKLTAPRGEILDREGRVLAANKPGFTVSILDLDRRQSDRIIAELAVILDMEGDEIRSLIRQQRYRQFMPVRLKTDVDEQVVAELAERRTDLPGVILEVQPIRIYPEDNLAAHIIGRTGTILPKQLQRWNDLELGYHMNDIVGREGGIEEAWEPYLRGQDGGIRVEVNNLSQTTRVEAKEDPIPGDSVYLTLDARVQRDLEMAMRKTMEALNATNPRIGLRGAAVAIDPRSGAILAMVSLPDYDLNTMYQKPVYSALTSDPNRPLNNWAIRGKYPVGSSYKVVTAVAGLAEGIISPTSRIYSPGVIAVPGVRPGARFSTKKNYDSNVGHGSINVVRALQVSSNTFFYQVGYRLGERLHQWGQQFSMDAPTGLQDILGEVAGTLASDKNANALMDAAIGQRHAFTPLQMANMIAMAANEGTHYRPYLVDRVVDVAGNVVYQAEPEILNQLDVSPQNWKAVKQGLEAVLAAGGTAARFRNFPYPVQIAGKTGTAQVGVNIPPNSVSITYAPAKNPEIALAVIIERTGTSSQAAVPITWDFYVSYFAPRFEEGGEGGGQ
jgi:penicillin-binding protein 2